MGKFAPANSSKVSMDGNRPGFRKLAYNMDWRRLEVTITETRDSIPVRILEWFSLREWIQLVEQVTRICSISAIDMYKGCCVLQMCQMRPQTTHTTNKPSQRVQWKHQNNACQSGCKSPLWTTTHIEYLQKYLLRSLFKGSSEKYPNSPDSVAFNLFIILLYIDLTYSFFSDL